MSTNKTIETDIDQNVIALADGRTVDLSYPIVMGILNVTPDSFSDGGMATIEEMTERALKMESEGAAIIDIGGESTRPGAEPVSLDEEISRVIPVIKAIRGKSDILISIDTYKAEVTSLAIEAGADMVNDISALRFSEKMADLVAEKNVPVILMHMLGSPRDMQKNPVYEDCVAEIMTFFKERLIFAESRGIERAKIVLDPGIGFGKRMIDNVSIIKRLREINELRLPVLIGLSRKSFINMIHQTDSAPSERIGGSIAGAVLATLSGAKIIRAHDVGPTVEALKVVQAISR